MNRDLKLSPVSPAVSSLEFSWDAVAGRLSGRDAMTVQALVDAAKAEGEVTSHPMPTSYAITDPLRKPTQMAAILGQYWRLPADLAYLLRPDEEADEPSDIEPIY